MNVFLRKLVQLRRAIVMLFCMQSWNWGHGLLWEACQGEGDWATRSKGWREKGEDWSWQTEVNKRFVLISIDVSSGLHKLNKDRSFPIVLTSWCSLDDSIFDFLYASFVQRRILPPELYFTLSLPFPNLSAQNPLLYTQMQRNATFILVCTDFDQLWRHK